MALGSLRRFEVQARVSVILAVVSVVPLVIAAALVYRNYHAELRQIIYGAEGRFVPLFLGMVLCSLLPAFLGFVLGWNSAGQRRNDKPMRSWVGFFVGGGVVTLDIVLMWAFYVLRLQTG